MYVFIIESWTVHDHWWTDDPIVNEYCEAYWDGRKLVFMRSKGEKIWRLRR